MTIPKEPKISIITATYNRRLLIGNAIQSVLDQSYPNVEHLVLDGASSDGTLEYLKTFSHLKIISEPDKGIYDAWNKGILKASGSIIGILNSDDVYNKHVFKRVAAIFKSDPSVMIVSGNAETFDVVSREVIENEYYHRCFSSELKLQELDLWGPAINAFFFNKELFKKVGLFDLDHGLSSDCEFMLRLALTEPHCKNIEETIYWYGSHAGSLTLDCNRNNFIRVGLEKMNIANDYIENKHLNSNQKGIIKHWHTQVSCTHFFYALKQNKFKAAYQFYRLGKKYSMLILVKYLQFILLRVVAKVKNKKIGYKK